MDRCPFCHQAVSYAHHWTSSESVHFTITTITCRNTCHSGFPITVTKHIENDIELTDITSILHVSIRATVCHIYNSDNLMHLTIHTSCYGLGHGSSSPSQHLSEFPGKDTTDQLPTDSEQQLPRQAVEPRWTDNTTWTHFTIQNIYAAAYLDILHYSLKGNNKPVQELYYNKGHSRNVTTAREKLIRSTLVQILQHDFCLP